MSHLYMPKSNQYHTATSKTLVRAADVEYNITVTSVICNERTSRSDRVTETITFGRNNQRQKDKQNVSERKSIAEQLN